MRRALFVLAAIVVLGASALVPTGAGQASAKPQLRLMDTNTLTVLASGFRPREHVRLVVRDPGVITRNATAGAGGGFTMRIPGVSSTDCAGLSITATGDRGSRATLKRAPGMCAQP